MAKAKSEAGQLKTGMLSFTRSLQPSEGLFWGTKSDDPEYGEPIEVSEKGVRGQSSEFNTKNPGKSNPQAVEAATVPPGCDGVMLAFTMWIAPFARKPSACGDPAVGRAYEDLVNDYAKRDGFKLLAQRYLWNIANGRFAWRNRFQADEMRVEVSFGDDTITFDPTRLSLDVPAEVEELSKAALSNDPAPVEDLIKWITTGLQEERKALAVAWKARMAEGQEVFPSQEYLREERAKGAPSRVYAKLPRFQHGKTIQQASMHSQKIGAALRHIDTWHNDPEYGPIAVNPYGGVQETGAVLRAERSRGGLDQAGSFYALRSKPDDLFAAIEAAQGADTIPGDVHFVIANLVRGGVFGEPDKK